MFGWLKKRERLEHLRLVKQNDMAAEYLENFANTANGSVDPQTESLASELSLAGFAARLALSDLESYRVLPRQKVEEQLAVNKQLRRIYDQVQIGKETFSRQLGSMSDRIEPFDAKFTPNEGWKIFAEHFGPSFEQALRGQTK